MKSNSLVFRKFVYLTFFAVLCCLVYSSTISVALGQKKPGSLRQGTTSDDQVLCKASNTGDNDESEFCDFYNTYKVNKDTEPDVAKKARNRMIDLVQWQIEIYYKARKDNRKKLVAMLQTIFDVLEIGSAAAAGIIKGTLRAKTVIAQALSGFQAGRTSFNRNFDILQTQVLINTMNTNRAEIATTIESNKNLSVDEYTWYKAKQDLTRLLNAGTFSDALDTLVKTSGADAERAERVLAGVIAGEISPSSVTEGRGANEIIGGWKTALAGTDAKQKENAQKNLREVVTALLGKSEAIQKEVRAIPLTAESDGEVIRKGLIKIRGNLLRAGDDTSVEEINKTIQEIYKKNKPK